MGLLILLGRRHVTRYPPSIYIYFLSPGQVETHLVKPSVSTAILTKFQTSAALAFVSRGT